MSAQKGFTLIELLVVIAIIAILATVGLVVYSTTQKSARISKRIQDLQAIQTALATYYSATGSYPFTGGAGFWRSECANWGSRANNDVVPTGFVPNYMPIFPSDPSMNTAANTSCYIYSADTSQYKMVDYNVADITVTDLKAQPNLWDPRDPKNPNNATYCPGLTDGLRSFAIYSNTTTMCW